MKRTAVAFSVLAAVGGCVTTEGGRYMGESAGSLGGHGPGGPMVAQGIPGVQGPWGQPVVANGPYLPMGTPSGKAAADAMIANSMPPDLVQRVGYNSGRMMPGGILQAGGSNACAPGMACAAGGLPGMPGMMPPGMAGMMPPGMAGMMPPGMPGVMAPGMPGGGGYPPGAVAAQGALTGPYTAQFAAARSSIKFTGDPAIYGSKVTWYTTTPDGKKGFGGTPLEIPGRYNFPQGAIYRLRLSEVPTKPAEEFYPTLEIVPANARTSTFLAHSTVPIYFSQQDFDTVVSGNYLVKVIYLPDPQFQDAALNATGELSSTQLELGVDPIVEANKRGSILAIIRMGNIRLEDRHTPAMDSQPPGAGGPMGPGGPGGMIMVPPGAGGPMMAPQGGMGAPGGRMMVAPPPPSSGLAPGRTPAGGMILPPAMPGVGPTSPTSTGTTGSGTKPTPSTSSAVPAPAPLSPPPANLPPLPPALPGR